MAGEQVRDSRRPAVPVLLLPTGTGRSDYFISYSFDDALERLRSGILRQPSLEVWAARPDLDREFLRRTLHEQFMQDLKAKKGAMRVRHGLGNAPTALQGLRTQKQQRAAAKDVKIAAGWVAVGLLGILLAFNPILLIVVFLFALKKGVAAARKAVDYVGLTRRSIKIEVALEGSHRELSKREAKLDKREIDFAKAIDNLEVHVHPHLQDLLVAFGELEGRPHLPHEPAPHAPDVAGAYRDREYRRVLPGSALRSLDRHLAMLNDI